MPRPAVQLKIRELATGPKRFGVVREGPSWQSGVILARFDTREEARLALPKLRRGVPTSALTATVEALSDPLSRELLLAERHDPEDYREVTRPA